MSLWLTFMVVLAEHVAMTDIPDHLEKRGWTTLADHPDFINGDQ